MMNIILTIDRHARMPTKYRVFNTYEPELPV